MKFIRLTTLILMLVTINILGACESPKSGSTKFMKHINSSNEGYVKLMVDKDV